MVCWLGEFYIKKNLKMIIYIFLVMFITFVLCMIFIKPKVLNLKWTKEYEYIQNNKKNIEEVIIRNKAQLRTSYYKLDINKVYEILNNIEIKKETGFCSRSNVYLEFYFKDKINKTITFECENLCYDGKRYELKDQVTLYNKDESIPDKITESMIIVSNEDKTDCK